MGEVNIQGIKGIFEAAKMTFGSAELQVPRPKTTLFWAKAFFSTSLYKKRKI